jgi:hypothetical protein
MMRITGIARYLTLFLVALALVAAGLGSSALRYSVASAAELPPRPPVSPPAPRDPPPAVISVVQKPTPNVSVVAGGMVSYTFVATNHGRGLASETVITVPFDPEVISVVDASTSRPETWVSELGADFVEIRTGALPGGDTVTATLRMRVAASAPLGTSIAPRMSFEWSDRASGGESSGNLLPLVVGERDLAAAYYPLAIDVSDEGFFFSAAIFAPGEPVGLWYVTPSGRNVELGTTRADENGVIDLELIIGDDAAGDYSLVASGGWSGFTAVGQYSLVDESTGTRR